MFCEGGVSPEGIGLNGAEKKRNRCRVHMMARSPGTSWTMIHGLAFTQYCHYQYCTAGIAIQDGRGKHYIAQSCGRWRGGVGCPNKGGVYEQKYWFLFKGLEANEDLVRATPPPCWGLRAEKLVSAVQHVFSHVDDDFRHEQTRPERTRTTHENTRSTLDLAFTRYCHYQYYMAYIAIKGGRGDIIFCAMVCTVRGGEGGAQTKGLFANNSIGSCTKSLIQDNIL